MASFSPHLVHQRLHQSPEHVDHLHPHALGPDQGEGEGGRPVERIRKARVESMKLDIPTEPLQFKDNATVVDVTARWRVQIARDEEVQTLWCVADQGTSSPS